MEVKWVSADVGSLFSITADGSIGLSVSAILDWRIEDGFCASGGVFHKCIFIWLLKIRARSKYFKTCVYVNAISYLSSIGWGRLQLYCWGAVTLAEQLSLPQSYRLWAFYAFLGFLALCIKQTFSSKLADIGIDDMHHLINSHKQHMHWRQLL